MDHSQGCFDTLARVSSHAKDRCFNSHETVYEAQRFPSATVDVIGKQQLPGSIFSGYNSGGYLIWKLYTERKVFMDDRADV